MAEFLLEILSEEIPSRMQGPGARSLRDAVLANLLEGGFTWARADVFWTPRRLTLLVDGLPETQPDSKEERRGPRSDAPEKAVQGFLASVNLTRDQVEERSTKKGDFLFAVVERKGRATADYLADCLAETIAKVAWPKSMRWGDHTVRWVRPIQSILCLFDGSPVRFSYGPIQSDILTSGHRFHFPQIFSVASYADYRVKLRDARVMLNAGERESFVAAADGLDAAQEGLVVVEDQDLLEEVAGLVEWPVVLTGRFDEEFLAIPEEILLATMRGHQKYFALRHRDGRLAARFICVANLEASDGGKSIIAGNGRVLRARLSDAKFFWDQDRRHSLASRVPQLGAIIFHAKLGSLDQKVDRIEVLAVSLSDHIPGADRDRVRAAARLSKADLVSQVVGEFPELQGVMGRYYALNDGEPEDVAVAIAEHYSPKGPTDACPHQPISVAVALADKIDTLVGFFSIGETPTGSKDPFALRRAALGVIRLILENRLSLGLREVFSASSQSYGSELAKVFDADALMAFFGDRLKVYLRGRGIRHDLISAVYALNAQDNLLRVHARVEALKSFLSTEDGANLLMAHKRASNIVRIEVKNDGREYPGPANPDGLTDDAERDLARRLSETARESGEAVAQQDFGRAMAHLAALRGPIDTFFDRVKVNVEDVALRENRLRLLSQICGTLNQVADFSQIEG
ncbi:MAG: glycine--tRNA ligase subunit beta [Proteobacteria bacterium]|nr:glycine--tRNA ligase subunit beta [Pseudomonadota bacterium]